MSEAPAMSALTLRRPWSEAVVRHGKDIENRTWSTEYRGPLVIHAGLGWEKVAGQVHPEIAHLGMTSCPVGYVGGARLVAVCSAGFYDDACDCGPWAARGQYHWQLDRQVPLPRPLQGSGRLGLFTPPRHVVEAVHYAMRGGV